MVSRVSFTADQYAVYKWLGCKFCSRHFLHLYCLICDSDPASKDYFNKHIELMKSLEQDIEYEEIKSIDKFFNIE